MKVIMAIHPEYVKRIFDGKRSSSRAGNLKFLEDLEQLGRVENEASIELSRQ
jgi:hypothetical protein